MALTFDAIYWDEPETDHIRLRVTPATPDFPDAANVLTTDTTNGVAGTFDESARNTDPGIANVIKDVSYKIQNSSKVGTFDESARNTDPGIANVVKDVSYKIVNASKTGTFDEASRNVGTDASNIISGYSIKIQNVTTNGTATRESHTSNQVLKSAGGNYNDDNLSVGNVKNGISFGLSLTGTLVEESHTSDQVVSTAGGSWDITNITANNLRTGITAGVSESITGNIQLTTAENILVGIGIGSNGTEVEGTFDESTRNTDPGISNVKDGVTYKILNVGYEGTYAGVEVDLDTVLYSAGGNWHDEYVISENLRDGISVGLVASPIVGTLVEESHTSNQVLKSAGGSWDDTYVISNNLRYGITAGVSSAIVGNIQLTTSDKILIGTGIGSNSTEIEGSFDESSRNSDPGVSNVLKDVSYKIQNSSKVGTFDEASRNVGTSASNIISGYSIKIQNVTTNGTATRESHTSNQVLKSAGGNYNDDNLSVGNVKDGVSFGLSLTGTYDNSTNPDYILSSYGGNWNDENIISDNLRDGISVGLSSDPIIGNIQLTTSENIMVGIGIGSNGTEIIGTLLGSGDETLRNTDPGIEYVLEGITYKIYNDEKTGTLIVASNDKVVEGVPNRNGVGTYRENPNISTNQIPSIKTNLSTGII